ncbi:MAG: diphthine synthase [Candidatus Thermoplasmatota archaeon]|nr:diphthine synthase [Candidatus Thermoplasmatota archaeon]
MLYLVGLGLYGPDSITLTGLNALKTSSRVFMEAYTSFHHGRSISDYERAYGVKIEGIGREEIEGMEKLLDTAVKEKVTILVSGDPLTATTHNMLRLRAIQRRIPLRIIDNSSILTAFPMHAGLSIYRMGPPVSIPFFSREFRPVSPYRKVIANLKSGFHTLLLLDLRNGRTMEPGVVREELIEMSAAADDKTIADSTDIIVGSRIGSDDEVIFPCCVRDLEKMQDRSPMSIIVPAVLTEDERDFLQSFSTIPKK